MFGRPSEIPSPQQALPGRSESMQFDPVNRVLGTSMVAPFPDDCEQVVFGLGCFWGAERKFWNLAGVHTTAVGYAAGHTRNPSYQEVCSGMTGHNEVVLVVFRPAELGFDALVIDTEDDFVNFGLGRELAERLGADYIHASMPSCETILDWLQERG